MKRQRILVWDIAVRVFHWSLAISFLGAFLTAESERLRDVHVVLGYAMLGLVAFRLLWGLVGTRYARFRSFAFGPRDVAAYLKSLLALRPKHYLGHNPAGSWAIWALLALSVLAGATGYATYNDVGGHWLEETHEAVANDLVVDRPSGERDQRREAEERHDRDGPRRVVAGVVLGSLVHRENLVASMVTGRKAAAPGEGIGRAWRSVAAILLTGVLGFWWMQLQGPAPALASAPAVAHDQKDD